MNEGAVAMDGTVAMDEVLIFAIVGSVPFQLTFDVPVLAG
jgi:hypothetical protein